VPNEELVKKIMELLDTESDLGFLIVLKGENLERSVACIRARMDQVDGAKGHRTTRR